MFGFDGLDVGIREREAASKGVFPQARKCLDKEDLAGWFKSAAVAAGAVARYRDSAEAV